MPFEGRAKTKNEIFGKIADQLLSVDFAESCSKITLFPILNGGSCNGAAWAKVLRTF
jgi:hypothetical protein